MWGRVTASQIAAASILPRLQLRRKGVANLRHQFDGEAVGLGQPGPVVGAREQASIPIRLEGI